MASSNVQTNARPPLTPGTPLHRLQTSLDALKYQHAALANLIPVLNPSDLGYSTTRTSPLPATTEAAEEEHPSPKFSSSKSKRLSVFSNHSEGSIWYDAPEFEGAEEFVLEAAPAEETPSSKISVGSPQSVPDELEWEGSDSDTEGSVGGQALQDAVSTPESPQETQKTVVRRTQLPSPPVGDEGSLFAILKKNVGKVRYL